MQRFSAEYYLFFRREHEAVREDLEPVGGPEQEDPAGRAPAPGDRG